ncbi:macrophage mannose receptor 1 isoform X1 [Larimichthys crocea]|uniref:macrophage mannose receptor 1 isoform X1 n=1 Tax=Larimichthys crocea TaxID=215358 RepID=UPI000F5FAD5A|nr:macrophage mannose receptor 1 isoform X1 [Larimichthys crocea]
MEKVLLIVIAASGLCAVSSHAGRQYHFVYELKTWTEARSYCREKYTDLATIDNMEDMNTLNSMVDLSKMADFEYKHRAWIGLYDDVDSWRWSLSNRTFYTGSQAEFRKWQTKEPNNQHSGEHCTEMYSGLWNDINCEARLMAVCLNITGSDVTFVLINKTMTWTEAQKHCRTNYTDLASVRNMTENEMVKQLVPAGQTVWIGLYRDSWKWLDGSNSSFRYWHDVEPNNRGLNETCVAADFSHSGQWEDWNCDVKREFVCYSVTGVTKQVLKVKLKLKKDSSRDLNDPAVMEDMLKQLRQRLKDQGVNPDDVKLSWRKQADGKVFHKVEKKTEKKTKKTEL